MEWEKLFKRYVWNDQTTPYLTAVKKLNRRQADSEILIYSLFLGIFFFVACIASLKDAPNAPPIGVTLYSFSAVCASVIFYYLKTYYASLYLSATPLAVIVYMFVSKNSIGKHSFDTLIDIVILLCLLRYSFRMVAIAWYYPPYKYNDHDTRDS